MIKKIFKSTVLAICLFSVVGGAFVVWLVVFNPSPAIRQQHIENILAMESPVFYNDGQSKIGVFFKEAHRQYIQFHDIPKDFVNAIVAAEDNSFFTHFGVDISGVLRAFLANIRAGRIVQGGSTITQQTAKNLFKRKDRSYISKLKELLFALELEYHYPKEKIMEFYANQFYVSGNGHGLGVAARYFFNKSVGELDLLECAFIAGSVKRPNYYNPFLKDSEEAVRLTKYRAKERTAYVLRQMYKLGMISKEQLQEQLARDISFNKGKMKYPLNTLMDTVKNALNTPEVEEALAQNGIDNISTSGIRIFTTVDKGLQENGLYALRKELSRIDVRLRGYEREEVQNRYRDIVDEEEDEEPAPGSFLFGRITGIDLLPTPSIRVSFAERAETGRIDTTGLMPLLNSLIKWEKQRWSKAGPDNLPLLLEQLHIGDLVYVQVRKKDAQGNEFLLDLEKYPDVQGALLAMQNGAIRAMVGGMENHFFNRAISAKRPMGSIMKPLVYAAALQLGWNSIDPLNNYRDVFVFQDMPYFPRPDHVSPHTQVSMSWAGVQSENLATVWLLYHLCDRLTPGEFKDLIAHLGLNKSDDESYQRYMRRIRDDYGIIVNQDVLYRAAFNIAVKEVEPDLIFAGHLDEYAQIKTLHYGVDFDKFLGEVELLADEEVDAGPQKKQAVEKEIEIRKNILRKNFISFMRLREELRSLQQNPTIRPGTAEELTGRLYYDPQNDRYAYATDRPLAGNTWQEINKDGLAAIAKRFSLTAGQASANEFWDSILVGGILSPTTLDLLNSSVEKEYNQLAAQLPYSQQVLHNLQDFRVTAGLLYLCNLGQTLGIRSKLDPVLSFPLGSNVISLLETVRMYEALLTGDLTIQSTNDHEELAILDRIEDSDGNTIYRPEPEKKKIFSSKTSLVVDDILQNVVRFGTGQYARDNVTLRSSNNEENKQLTQLDLRVPLFGKTGTANRFINSAFTGLIPEVGENGAGLSIPNGYVVGAYVGFDDNTPMVRTSTHITGASGALHLWTRFASTLLLEKKYSSQLDLIDITFAGAAINGSPSIPLIRPDLGQIEVDVQRDSGLPKTGGAHNPGQSSPTAATVVTFGKTTEEGEFAPSRSFTPYWDWVKK
jgi:penicillin-binding protein 1A